MYNLLVSYVLIDSAEVSVMGASQVFSGYYCPLHRPKPVAAWCWPPSGERLRMSGVLSSLLLYAFMAGTETISPLRWSVFFCAQYCENTTTYLRMDSLLGKDKLCCRMCCRLGRRFRVRVTDSNFGSETGYRDWYSWCSSLYPVKNRGSTIN
jgi:hypothetical protein